MNALTRIAAVAGIEFRIALRNRWVILSTAMLTLFALALSFPGEGGAVLDVDALTLSASSLSTLSVYLIPLIALLVSYDSIAGEVERGTMAIVLATPLQRLELLMGKFIGLTAVVTIAVVVGYGIAASATSALYGADTAGIAAWLRLLLTAVLLGAVFVAAGMVISAAAPRSGMAAALAVGIWLVVVVLYDLVLLGGLVADDGGVFTKVVFPYLVVANPGDAFRIFNLAALEAAAPVSGLDGLASTLPFPAVYALVALAGWLLAMLAAGLAVTRRLKP
jgi:Cu-processing system permease protein